MVDKPIVNGLGENFFKLAEKSQDVFWIRNNNSSKQLYVSPAYEVIWMRSCDDLYADPTEWIQSLHPDDYSSVIDQLTGKIFPIETNSSWDVTYRILRPTGEIRWIRDAYVPLFDSDELHIGFAGVSKDITQEVEREVELKPELLIASQFLPKLAERMEKSVFWVRDATLQKQLYLSQSYEKVWGRSCESLYKNPASWSNNIYKDDREVRTVSSMLYAKEELHQHAKYYDVYRIQRPDGELRWIKDVSFPIYDTQENCIGFAGVAEDITSEKLYELALKEAKEKAETASHAKSEFLASMSHDLRTPLHAILGLGQILRNIPHLPEQEEYFDMILQAGKNLLRLVEDVLSFSKIEADKLELTIEQFDLRHLIEEICGVMQHQINEKNLELIIEYSENIPRMVMGDSQCTHRVLINLIGNAIKFTEKGYVYISVDCVNKIDRTVYMQFAVEDTGIGIPSDKLDMIFDRFSRVEPSYRSRYGGVGLGLSIVRQLADILGGDIRVMSKMGHGSKFLCNLPFKISDSIPPISSWQSLYANKLQILIVDNHDLRARVMKDQLSVKECVIIKEQQILNFLQESKIKNHVFDIIILDDELQDVPSLQLGIRIREEKLFQKTMLVFVTKKLTLAKVETYKLAGFNHILTKPIQPSELILSLTNVWESWCSCWV